VGIESPSPTVPATAGKVAVYVLDAEAETKLTAPPPELARARVPVVVPDLPIVKVEVEFEYVKSPLPCGQVVPPKGTSPEGMFVNAMIVFEEDAQRSPPGVRLPDG